MTRTVYIAEDDEDVRQLLTFKLTQNGFDVTQFPDGEACVEHLQERTKVPNIVVLDVMMPRMDGLQVLEVIREDDTLCELPVLMLTARSREEDVVKGFKQGATDYVTKPFSPNEVVARIERLLGQA